MLHFTNGSIVVAALAASGLPGRAFQCADPLHEGPCLPGLSPPEWRELRFGALADSDSLAMSGIIRDVEARDAVIDAAASEDEIVLWFEHDLFDQLNLIWLVDRLADVDVPPERITLVVIGSHPEIPRFHGLGQLSPAQLRELFPSRVRLGADAQNEARVAWAEVCAPDPRALADRAGVPSRAWPFLPGALQRLVEEYPAIGSGLSRTERQGLQAVADGATTLGEAFVGCASREERVYLGDWSFYEIMRRLCTAANPLAASPGAFDITSPSLPLAGISLTDTGRRVLAGELDYAAINGLDRWVGGVHLLGSRPPWRVTSAGSLELQD